MGAACYGYDTGFFGGTIALTSFQRDFGMLHLSASQFNNASANLVSLFQGGSFFGAGLQYPITLKIGRKWTIILSNVLFIASGFMQVFANGSLDLMMGGRFMGGFAIGISSLVIPIYLSEYAPANIRGRLVGFFDIFIQVGTIFGFWTNYIIVHTVKSGSKFQWQFPCAIQLFPAAIMLVGMFFIPETPRFLMMKKREDEAAQVLSRLRKLPQDHEYLKWELAQIQEQLELEESARGKVSTVGLFKQLFQSRDHRKRLGLGLCLIFFKTFSGVQAVNYYSPRIFQQLGFTGQQNSLFATGIYGTVKVVCTLIFGLFIIDRVGRRRPLLVGCTIGAGCLWFIGGYLSAVGPRDGRGARTAGDYVAIVAIFLYAAIYCFGWNSVPLTLISEIFSMRFRAPSMTLCLMWQWLCTFAIVRIMPIALTNIKERTYFVFGSIFMCGVPFVYFFVPETTQLPLEAMDTLFGSTEAGRDEKEDHERLETIREDKEGKA
ncbi:general substrate transporter [Flagelloscypha sp. PMI_526]|nr:general substrate transporter [Flagelloscypha sp. PMI_526]